MLTGGVLASGFAFYRNKFCVLRNTYYYCGMKVIEKRTPRSYKAKKTPYVKAAKRAEREGTTLSQILEAVVIEYANPQCGILIKKNGGYRGIKTVLFDQQEIINGRTK